MEKTGSIGRRLTRGRWGAAFAATLLVAACGGGSDASSDSGGDLATARMLTTEVAAAGGAAAAGSSSPSCLNRVNNTFNKLLECVTLAGVRRHQQALQTIADENNGIRTSGTPGYDASVDYAAQVLRDAGYLVTVTDFQFQTFITLSPTVLEQVSPGPAGPLANNIMEYSGSGDVTASVTALTPPPGDGTPGCEAADFAGFPAGNIALISRGACPFALKATNALAAGASGVVIYNNTTGDLNGTLGEAFTEDIGVTGITQALGQQLAATPGLVLRLKTDTFRGEATTSNIIAESRTGDPNNVVMVGAHLDSVNEGPGINDNGSGVAAILETAVQMAKVKPRNKLRFALWGAEESGLVGSTNYVNGLSQAEKDRIALYLNFDMIGSPNHVFFVYDGDDSDATGEGPGPGGSDQIEKAFESFYMQRGVPFKGTDFDGRSDYRAFIQNLIPAGGLFTGAEGVKTAEEAALWGGTAGTAYDPCYHQACDTFANNSDTALDINADAVAYTTLLFSMNTSSVNDQRGKGNFRMPALKPLHPERTGN
ncbi:M28 family metallopeptidase [Hydrogenophaga pseudoflava]|uniref:Leupeptin-inactivating enzyme 1 n=1 Tax=Hydrogenophaga pseudoflava TaxID=47421 RepID=A0A4P6WZQ9_HYDPS|nr:M28 family metallopeptidase [Hydrogenophaga pseudoflava]QBM29337.1 Leupeptin-inactivating enzyme 1 precursor [Hydrogenophaga pseudoflava]